MKLLKSIKMIVALVLTLTMIALVPLNTAAAANDGNYVSEVYVAYGKDANEARNTLVEKGFTPVDGNLNDGGKTYAMMGFKITRDIRESITNLAVMNMRGDYSVEDYKKLLKDQKTEIADSLTELMAVIKEYRANLKAGKAKAIYVHDVLNNYIEDEFNQGMGDLLNEETLQDKVGIEESVDIYNDEHLPDLVTILMQGNAQVIKSIEVLLSMATDTADNSWIDRFAESDYDTLLDKVEEERPELNTETKRKQYIENLYGLEAALLGEDVLELRNKLLDYEEMDLHIDTATAEDIEKTFGDSKTDEKALFKKQEWLKIGEIYENLKNYEGGKYKKGELLAFFLQENDPKDDEIFIPMAAALSEGQRYGMIFVNLEDLINYAFTNDEGWKKVYEDYKNNLTASEKVSVYQNIDRDLYKDDGSVALTGSAQRANNTADGTTGSKDEQMDAYTKIVVISYIATVGGTVSALISNYGANMAINAAAYDYLEGELLEMNLEKIFDDDVYELFKNAVTDGDFEANFFRSGRNYTGVEQLGLYSRARFMIRLTRIISFITMAIAFAGAVLTIIDLCRDKSVEQLPIPKYLVNNYTDEDGGSYALNYKAVECNREEYFGNDYKKQKGDCADLLADEGKQWLVLYASKNSKAGRPLTPDFLVQESINGPAGYDGFVNLIGENGAVNIVSGAFRNYSSVSTIWQYITADYSKYIFYKHSKDVKTYDESAGNMTASAVGGGMIAIWGFGGLALGAVLGAVIAIMINKNKKKKETA